ncbi:hypothetical protein EBO15_32410 [Actinomadura harenae]|uniref:Uncharacterized protein n=2 Tax=Actinomadura harenae TaxID=2483351 RepID=A0A3M2LM89_9ACTN|nr:hypothetical protein EBO15_32410 [Actinomadura harenae]
MRLERIVRHVYGEGRAYLSETDSPLLRDYVHDLGALWGVEPRAGLLTETVRTSYAEMVEDLVPRLDLPDRPVDVVAIAGSAPDADVLRSPTSVLTELVPGAPLPLGVTDQGSAGPFTALRIVQGYRPERAILMVLDQSRLWYDLPLGPEQRPDVDCGVALVFGPSGVANGFTVERRTDVAPGDLASLIPAGDHCLIAGNGLRGHVPEDVTEDAAEVRFAPSGQPCTGVWQTLAEALPDWRGRRVVIAEYDPVLRYLSLCTVEVE